ncbi:protelomerase family protein [Dictyobacter aurantiacus]
MPREEKVETRRERPLPLARPWDVLKKVEQLLQSQAWPELVVGIGLSTGRGIVEILHTGHFTRKSAYSLLFAAPMTVYEVLCVPFEVPTLVRVEVVLAAVDRVRQYFGKHFQGLRRREISQQCRPQIQEAAYKQAWSLVPLRPEERNAYKRLAHEVYPQLAAWLYCPTNVDPLVYMATIEYHRKILEATSEEERLTLALAAGYREYVVMDTNGVEDQRHGIRLGEPGVEVLSVFQANKPDEEFPPGHVWTLEEVKAALAADPNMDDDWDAEDLEVLRLSLSTVILGKDGTIDRRRGIKLGEPGVRVLEEFQPRDEEEGERPVKDDLETLSLPPLMDEKTAVTREEVQERKEDASLPHLLACFIYEVQVNVIENDPPAEILDTLATLIEHAPVFVMELVEGLRRMSPEDQEEDYPSRLPTCVDGDAGERHKIRSNSAPPPQKNSIP